MMGAMGYGLDSRILLILSPVAALRAGSAKDLICLPSSVVAIFLGRVSRSLALLGMRTSYRRIQLA